MSTARARAMAAGITRIVTPRDARTAALRTKALK